jgi:hypothetical protein
MKLQRRNKRNTDEITRKEEGSIYHSHLIEITEVYIPMSTTDSIS